MYVSAIAFWLSQFKNIPALEIANGYSYTQSVLRLLLQDKLGVPAPLEF